MSAGCKQVYSSRTLVSIVPNTDCSAVPVIHQVKAAAAAVVGDTTISLVLDTAFTPASGGAYSATSKFALVPGTILKFGTSYVEVAEPANGSGVYFISTTATAVSVVRLKSALANNATAQTYFAIRLCLKSSNITTNTTQVDNTTNCTGTLSTQVNVAYMKTLELAGFMASGDYGYHLLSTLGKDLQSVFFHIDYDGRFLVSGVAQLTEPSITDSAVKQLAGYTLQGQVQSIDNNFGSFLSATDLAAMETLRSLAGFNPSKGVVTV